MDSATIRAKPSAPQDLVHAALLKIVDRRLHVLSARLPERRVSFPVHPTKLSLLRQRVQQFVQCNPRAVETAIETAQVGEASLCFPDHGHRMVHVTALPQDPVVQEEAVLVLQHGHRHAEFHRHLPFTHQRSSKIENTFSSCGIFSP